MTKTDSAVGIVTGAASGIGRATVLRLAAEGYRVALVDIDRPGLVATLDRIGADPAQLFETDLRDPDAADAVVGDIETRLGPPTLLVNVAGVAVAANVPDTNDSDWHRVLDVNLTAPFRLTRAVLPGMVARGGGVIVNVASVAAMVGIANRAAYCASKAGLVGLTRAVAADHAADGIRCVAICPGTVETEWISKILANADDPEEKRREMQRRQLDNRMGTPEEVAAAIAFVAGADGRFVNGSALVIDGGMTAV
ncbi:SDR family oxidoreductase [Dactylosporangium sp. NPDC050688]|uniref:SDR family NAD(P)-dependent oxidoreductase n=1 Tax=Dactylosporangium sp. NPDC050688 TaxID=3157217 RepID=UPI0033F92471